MQLRLVVVTNFPSPYRLHEFSVLNHELTSRGIDFEAIILATTEPDRHWVFRAHQCDFPYQIAPGWSFSTKHKTFLFNPHVIWGQWKRPPTWLWLGGAWYLPTVVGLSWLMPLRRSSWLLGWNESTEFDRHTLLNPLEIRVRHLLLRPHHGWVVPGSRAAAYTHPAVTSRKTPILTFANTVDEALYRDRVSVLRACREALRGKYDLPVNRIVCLWPARLSPEKGIIPFLDAIRQVDKSRFTILVAGEGPQRSEIETWLDNHHLDNVRLLGHQDIDNLLELYALADVLLLPSISEPYGFAAVEALWAGLPLFLSDRVGAIPEVLEPGVNGWIVDPDSPQQVRQKFVEMIELKRETLAQMGQHSLRLAEENFASRPAVSHFVDDLVATFPPRS